MNFCVQCIHDDSDTILVTSQTISLKFLYTTPLAATKDVWYKTSTKHAGEDQENAAPALKSACGVKDQKLVWCNNEDWNIQSETNLDASCPENMFIDGTYSEEENLNHNHDLF